MAYAFRRQPLRGLYIAYAFTSGLFIRLPWWIILSLLRSQRPRPSWSLKRCLLVRLVRYITLVNSRVLFRSPVKHLAILEGVDVPGIWVEGVPNLVLGDVKKWAEEAGVEATKIPGYWIYKKGKEVTAGMKPMDGEKVVYLLHGGAYILLSAHPSDVIANIPRGLLKHCPELKRSFSIEYRLSTADPLPVANCFPAALIDALAGYNYLVNTIGFSPSDIIVVGDSAGGNLAVALVRYLVETPLPTLPVPGALLLLSPWSALGGSHHTPGPDASEVRCQRSDYLLGPESESGLRGYAERAFLGPLGASMAHTNAYISPASLSLPSGGFKGFPRAFVVAGDAEMLLDQIRTLAARMRAEIGEESVVYYEVKDAVHDFLVLGSWFEPQTSETLQAIANWVSTL